MTPTASRWLLRGAVASAGLLAIGVAAIATRLALVPSARTQHYDVPYEAVAVASDGAAIARGKHLAESVAACTICHGENLGGRLAFDHPLLGKGYTPNLTRGRGGVGASYQVADWVRALRHGVGRDGRGLLFMPVDHYRHLSDADLGALIAWFRSLPAVDNERNTLELSVIAKAMIDLGLSGDVVRAAAIDHHAARLQPPADEGAYLVEIGGCTFCHGPALTGGRGLEPGAPRGPDLTRSGRLGVRGCAALVAAMRTGTAADGHAIDPRFMPWQAYRRMTDDELLAVCNHLQRVPPR
jgi:cytochrome c553